jgi:hypothetical protein
MEPEEIAGKEILSSRRNVTSVSAIASRVIELKGPVAKGEGVPVFNDMEKLSCGKRRNAIRVAALLVCHPLSRSE